MPEANPRQSSSDFFSSTCTKKNKKQGKLIRCHIDHPFGPQSSVKATRDALVVQKRAAFLCGGHEAAPGGSMHAPRSQNENRLTASQTGWARAGQAGGRVRANSSPFTALAMHAAGHKFIGMGRQACLPAYHTPLACMAPARPWPAWPRHFATLQRVDGHNICAPPRSGGGGADRGGALRR